MEQTDKTQAEKIERLATEVMGWRKGKPDDDGFLFEDEDAWYEPGEDEPSYSADGCDKRNGLRSWNPLISWDAWRQVELKVMEDEELLSEYISTLDGTSIGYLQLKDGSLTFQNKYMKADLPTRVDALLSAIDSLKS